MLAVATETCVLLRTNLQPVLTSGTILLLSARACRHGRSLKVPGLSSTYVQPRASLIFHAFEEPPQRLANLGGNTREPAATPRSYQFFFFLEVTVN